MLIATQQSWNEYQLKSAVRTFLTKVDGYCNSTGRNMALSVETKQSIVPYLTMLAACGWPAEKGKSIIDAKTYNTKSLQDSHLSLKSIADFADRARHVNPHSLHIALYHIGNALEASTVKNNPWHKPAGSPNGTGGQFDFSPDNGGAGHRGGGGNSHPSPTSTAISPQSPIGTAASPARGSYRVTEHSRTKVTVDRPDGTSETRTGGSRAWRNNNPGNIRSGSFANRYGAIGEAGGFAVFPDEETGQNASIALLRTSTYADLSVDQAIARRSPSSENDTEHLQGLIHKISGLSGEETVKDLTPSQMEAFVEAIKRTEGWIEGEITTHRQQ